MDLGDYALGATIHFHFTTRQFSTGAPFTLAGTPVISAYEDDSLTQITAGITLSVDFDSITGLNHVVIVASSGNGFESGKFYSLVVTTGTVDSVSVVGEVISRFTLEARSALRPTTAGRTLDVSSTGEAGVDWANIGSPTTVQGLSGTTVKTATDVETDTQDIQSRLPAALVSGRMDSDVGAIQNGVIVAATFAAGALDAVWSTASRTLTSFGTLVNDVAVAVWEVLTSTLTTAGTIGKLLVDNINTTISSRLASADITLTGGKVTVGTNDDKTGYSIGVGGISSTAFAAGAIDAAALAQDAEQEIADEVLDRDIAGGGSGNTRNVRNALRSLRNKVSTTGGTLVVTEEDDSTTAWTGAVTRDAAADPITVIDPT